MGARLPRLCRRPARGHPPGQPARSWLVCDRRFLRRYGLGYVRPAPLPIAAHLRSGYLKRGTSLDQLAGAAASTRPAWPPPSPNTTATPARGDPEFGRGGTAFNRKQGDPAYPGPNPLRRPHRTRTVLRGAGRARLLRHLRRAEDRRPGPACWTAAASRSPACTRRARTWRACSPVTIPPAASTWGRR